MDRMRAIVFDGSLRLVEDHPRPEPSAGESLVRVRYAGVCATDIEITRGYMGFNGVPGHEFSGVVEASEDAALVGKAVVGEINIGCGRCGLCREGLGNHCKERRVLGILGKDGVFAEYMTLPDRNLHIVPDGLSLEEAVFTEPLAAAFEITEQIDITRDDRVCVLGDGRLGLLVAQVLKITGCDLVAAGRHPEKLSILSERGIRTSPPDDASRDSFDIVVDCTGSPGGLDTALDLVRPRGTVVLKTTVAEREGGVLNRVVIDEVTVVGSRCGPFTPALDALSRKSVSVRPLIQKVYPLEEGVAAIGEAGRKGALKVLIKVS